MANQNATVLDVQGVQVTIRYDDVTNLVNRVNGSNQSTNRDGELMRARIRLTHNSGDVTKRGAYTMLPGQTVQVNVPAALDFRYAPRGTPNNPRNFDISVTFPDIQDDEG